MVVSMTRRRAVPRLVDRTGDPPPVSVLIYDGGRPIIVARPDLDDKNPQSASEPLDMVYDGDPC